MSGQDDSAEFYFDGDNTKAAAGAVNEHACQYRFNWNTSAQWGTAFVVAPLKASGADPKDGAVGVQMPLFQWTAGKGAFFHNVYLGATPDLGPEQLVGPRQVVAMFYYGPGLQPGTTYYWRVDETVLGGAVVAGPVWSFVTWLPVDDFESYGIEEGTRIFDAWVDGSADRRSGINREPASDLRPSILAALPRTVLPAAKR